MQLSIIFVNWNSTDYLLECIASILEFTRGVEFELIVVDNASPDGRAEILEQQFETLKLIRSPENIGFARANNLGFRHSTGSHVLFLNPDTKLVSPAIQIMLRHLNALEDAGITGCKLLNTDLSVQTSCIQTFPTVLNQALDSDFLRRRWPRSRLWGTRALLSDGTAPAQVEVVSGACMMLKRDVFERIGMFSEEYFMYAEDLDLCRKAVNAGYRNYFIGEAAIVHHGGKSSVPETATIAKWRSILQYFEKHHGDRHTMVFRSVMSVIALLRVCVLSLGVVHEPVAGNRNGYSTITKWKAILSTLLHHSVGQRAASQS
jgi:GT2 family glycosyltransferase